MQHDGKRKFDKLSEQIGNGRSVCDDIRIIRDRRAVEAKYPGPAVKRKELRFHELRSRIPAVSEKVLTQQSNELVKDELVFGHQISTRPLKVIYRPTSAGNALLPAMMGLYEWGNDLLLVRGQRSLPEARL